MKTVYSKEQIDAFVKLTDNYIQNYWKNTSLVAWREMFAGIIDMARMQSEAARAMGYWDEEELP